MVTKFYLLSLFLLSFFHVIDCCARTAVSDTTTIAPPCTAPSSDSLGMSIEGDDGLFTFDEEAEAEIDLATPTHRCTSCTSVQRNFYSAHTRNDVANDAVDDGRGSVAVQCQDSTQQCVCLTDGSCCTVGMNTPFLIIPYCAGQTCNNNIFLSDGQLNCEGGITITFDDQLDENGDDLPLGHPNYLNADAVSCNGCSNIRSAVCEGPTVTF